MPFDDILHIVGAANRYQIEVLVMMSICQMFSGIVTLLPVFILAKRQYSCIEPYLSNNGSQQCQLDNSVNATRECSEWNFTNDPMDSTLQSQYTLTCSNEVLASLTTTFYFLGFMAGCSLYGKISDKFGRRISVIISFLNVWLASMTSILVPWYWLYSVLRFLAGAGVGGLITSSFTMTTEIVDAKHRLFWTIFPNQGWSIGFSMTALVAYFVRNHVHLQLIIYSPFILTLPLILVLVKESPRWLFTKRRINKLNSTLKYIAKRNKMTLDAAFDLEEFYGDDCKKPKERTFRELVAFRSLRRITFTTWFNWFVVSSSYYVVTLGVGSLGGNIFLNAAIVTAIELPSRVFAFFLAKRLGRIPTLSMALALGGASAFINAYMFGKPHLIIPLTVIAMIAKMSFTIAFDVVWIHSMEIFPTEIRNLAVGIGSTWARVGGIISTLVRLIGLLWAPAPFVLLGILPVLSAVATCSLPETKSMMLPETMEEGEALARKRNKIIKILAVF